MLPFLTHRNKLVGSLGLLAPTTVVVRGFVGVEPYGVRQEGMPISGRTRCLPTVRTAKNAL